MEELLDIAPPSNLPGQTQSSGQGPAFIQNGSGFRIVGGQFVYGDVYNQTASGPSHITALPLNIMDDNFSDSEIYCNQLLRRKRGFPMYIPAPRQNLPDEYQRRGIAIGDVGRVTPEGLFDFFFNIYLSSEHPINVNLPEDFVPMVAYTPEDVLHLEYEPGNFVSTSSIQKLDSDSEMDDFPGGDFFFNCDAPQGAALALPHGAHVQKLANLESLREYVAIHAEKWYKYINGPRGRRLANGCLYLVTGWEKAPAWGIASFYGVEKPFPLAFKPRLRADLTMQYRWSGAPGHINPAQTKLYDPFPIDERDWNQTTFIHGLSISLGTGIWGKLFGSVKICEIAESPLGTANSNSTSRPQGSSLFPWSLGFLGGGSTGGGTQHIEQVAISDLAPLNKAWHILCDLRLWTNSFYRYFIPGS
ncbi:hypothetical protein C8R47DRAFT_1236580 [Mycena vitilis]|nr:hypothetical protein C8R47DRAFT_1236580 [Mycena vitilis]